jgi:glycosyltransferase involved in cell wall biosynthesis
MQSARYALITAAYNEEKFIGLTIASVVSQTMRPARWIIVSDGSTDGTDNIVRAASERYDFIRLVRLCDDHPRNFAAQANAIGAGQRHLQGVEFDFVGNIDADISFAPDYFARLLSKFSENARLGLAGGWIHEMEAGIFKPSKTQIVSSVPHGVQLFRRECFETLGGYPALPYGGPDTYAEVWARMHGWQVRSIPELTVCHHRPASSAGGVVRGRFRQGRMDFSLGYYPAFEAMRCLRRWNEPPLVAGAVVRSAGFLWAWLSGQPRAVSNEFIDFFRQEQAKRLHELVRFRPVRRIPCPSSESTR